MRFDALEAPERIDAQNRRQIAKHQVNVYHGGPQAGAAAQAAIAATSVVLPAPP